MRACIRGSAPTRSCSGGMACAAVADACPRRPVRARSCAAPHPRLRPPRWLPRPHPTPGCPASGPRPAPRVPSPHGPAPSAAPRAPRAVGRAPRSASSPPHRSELVKAPPPLGTTAGSSSRGEQHFGRLFGCAMAAIDRRPGRLRR
nr:anther-specific proline-rich protein APG-like [Aegilops tauschii subsp. strangulata]